MFTTAGAVLWTTGAKERWTSAIDAGATRGLVSMALPVIGP